MSAPVEHSLLDPIAEHEARERVQEGLRLQLDELGERIDRLDDQGVDTHDLVVEYQALQSRVLG